ncbi:MAG: hypothetical protein AAGI52_11810 [Bacteroidota bacterium]
MDRLPQKRVGPNGPETNRQPLLVTKDGVFVPPGETDENKRLALQTWGRAQYVRYIAYAVGSAIASGMALLAALS